MNIKEIKSRFKEPVKNEEDRAERKKFFRKCKIVLAVVMLASGILAGADIPVLSGVLIFVCLAAMLALAYVCLCSVTLKKQAKKEEKLTCKGCGARLRYDESVSFEYVSSNVLGGGDHLNDYVTLRISCRCPVCGKDHSFHQQFRDITVTGTNADNIHAAARSYESLVRGFFGNEIQIG